ncbi:MAG: preprotein translocase subunit YajC [Clostridia bacterium]|nr:preprotein translocase subunit YajC [Clostridia bacterium]
MQNLINLFLDTASEVSGTVSGAEEVVNQPWWANLIGLIPLVLLAVVFYFMIYRPQKKQEKETRDMRNSLCVGDIITTVGGVIGKVLRIKDNTIVIESGGQKLLIQRWAIRSIDEKAHPDEEDA